jgi:hypothetical protein
LTGVAGEPGITMNSFKVQNEKKRTEAQKEAMLQVSALPRANGWLEELGSLSIGWCGDVAAVGTCELILQTLRGSKYVSPMNVEMEEDV